MPFLIVVYFLLVGIVALLTQMILPVIFPILNVVGLGSALVPLVVIYASLELGDWRALLLATILGLFLDLRINSHHLGSSALILGSLSALIVTQAHKPESHHWLFGLIYVLVGTFAFLLLDYLFMLGATGRWYWPLDVWSKITFASLLNLAIAPLFFYLVGLLPRRCGWKPAHELHERRYAR